MSWEIKQRANFYLEEFQPPKIPGDLRAILIGAGLHVGIAVITLFGLVINWHWQGHRLEGMIERQAIVEQQVANIESERPPLKLNDALVAQRSPGHQAWVPPTAKRWISSTWGTWSERRV